MGLTQAAGRDHLDGKPSRPAHAPRARARRTPNSNSGPAPALREDRLQHRLGAAEALPHGTVTSTRIARTIEERPRCPDAAAVNDPDPRAQERVTLAHDYLLVMRGAERTFAAMAELYPQRADLHPAVRRGRAPSGRFAGHAITTSFAAASRHRPARLQAAAAAVPARRRAPAPAAVRGRAEQQQRVRARPARARGRDPRLLLPCAVSLRVVRAGARARRGPGAVAAAAAPAAARMRRWDLAGEPSRGLPTSRTRSSRRSASSASTGATRRSSIRPWRPTASRRASPATTCWSSRELVRHKRVARRARGRAARAARRSASSAPGPSTRRSARPSPRPSSSDASATRSSPSCTRARARCSFRASRSSASPQSRRRRRDGPCRRRRRRRARDRASTERPGCSRRPDDVDSFAQAIARIDRLDFDPARTALNAERFSVAAFKRQISAQVTDALDERTVRRR